MTARTGPLAGRRVLVVDEEKDLLDLARMILSYGGARVTTCQLPDEAIPLLSNVPFDAVVTVFGFGNDPRVASRILHAVRQCGDRPAVLALTARKEAEVDLHAMGFDGVMVEPVDPFDLVAVVAAIIRDR